jgi:MbtH protein
MDQDDDKTIYTVVINHEMQYSIWPAHRQLPLGWTTVGKEGTRAECLAYIDEVWSDMRPLSLRHLMERMGRPTE